MSHRVRDYYLDQAGLPDRTELTRLLAAVEEELEEAEDYSADVGFVIHVLVCTKFRRGRGHGAHSDAFQEVPQPDRRRLIRGLHVLRDLGEEWLLKALGPSQRQQARETYATLALLHHLLTGGVIETPAFTFGTGPRPLKKRDDKRALTACIVCLTEQLKKKPKPAAATAAILEGFELLRRGRPGTVEFVKKRAARARAALLDRLGGVGNLVWLLKDSYAQLRDFLMPPEPIPERDPLWAGRAKAWGTTAALFRQAFQNFCDAHAPNRDAHALGLFERALTETRDTDGPAAVRRVFRTAAPAGRRLSSRHGK